MSQSSGEPSRTIRARVNSYDFWEGQGRQLPAESWRQRLAHGRLHLVHMLVANRPSRRLHRSPLQLREVEIEQGHFYVKLNSKRPIAQQEIEGHLMEKISAKVKVPECGQRA